MFRENLGRLLIVAAGGGCLVLLIFVFLPMLNEPAPQFTQGEIVAEVLGSDNRPVQGSEGEVPAEEGVMPGPSPLVGVWNDGREAAVVFPAEELEAEVAVLPGEVVGEEVGAEESVLPQILSQQDVAEARAALEGEGVEPVPPAEPDSAREGEKDVAAARELPEAAAPASGEELLAAPAAAEGPLRAAAAAGETDTNDGRDSDESVSVVAPDGGTAMDGLEAMVRALVRAMKLEREGAGVEDTPRPVERQAVRRGEFDVPVPRARREASHPSGGIPEHAAAEAAQAGNGPTGLPPRKGVILPGTLRGVMGYRLPLVSRQEVPDQIVSGVLIPAHTTFVILKVGSWELIDVEPEELQRLMDAEAGREAPVAGAQPVRRGWNPLRIFGKRSPAVE